MNHKPHRLPFGKAPPAAPGERSLSTNGAIALQGACNKQQLTSGQKHQPCLLHQIHSHLPMAALDLLDQAITKIDQLLQAAPAAAAPAPNVAAAAAPASKQAAAPAKAAAPAAAPKADPAAASNDALVSSFQKVLIKIARVLTVEPVENSEKLYKLTVDIGGGDIKQVCAGLRQFLPIEAVKDALVAAVCNLKPAKLAGNLSEAMLLAAEHEAPTGLVVRLLVPPPGSEPGDQVYLEGGAPSTDHPKKVDLKAVAAALKVANGGKATLDGTPLVTAKGAITVPAAQIPDGSAIH